MVAGDTKRVVVIKNISSNLIEEAILILKSGPETQEDRKGKPAQDKPDIRNDFILKEAEHIINAYINGNGLTREKDRRRSRNWSVPHKKALINIVINVLLMAAIALLIYVVGNAI